MDISLLKSLFSRPSLADYLPGGSRSAQTGTAAPSGALSLLGNGQDDSNSGDNLDLSAMARQILAAANGQATAAASSADSTSDDQTAAWATLKSFFTDNGVDFSKLSDQAKKLIQGFQDVIANSGATARDGKTDAMEEQYQGSTRKVSTLTGTNTRLRIAIDSSAGRPQTLTITDINGSAIETAVVTMTRDAGGNATGIGITRSQSAYVNGAMAQTGTPDPLSVALYANG